MKHHAGQQLCPTVRHAIEAFSRVARE